MGSTPPSLRSNIPRCSPEWSTTSPLRKPVGGLWESEKRASMRKRSGCSRAGRRVSVNISPTLAPDTGRLSTTTEVSTSALSWVGSSIHERAARCQESIDRTKSGSEALTRCVSGWKPQATRMSVVRLGEGCEVGPGDGVEV